MKSIAAVMLALFVLALPGSPGLLPEPAPPVVATRFASVPLVAPALPAPPLVAPAPVSSPPVSTSLSARGLVAPAPSSPRSADGTQTMGVSELDLVLPGTGGDPTGDRQVLVEADFAEVGDRLTGTLSGTVVDTQGNPLPGARVTVTGIPSLAMVTQDGQPAVRVAFTDALGGFRFYDLPPGSLRLIAELEGFATVEYPDLPSATDTSTRLEVTLSPAVEEVITVTSESPLLDERKIQQGTTINQIELEKIPTARDPWTVLMETPGVIGDRINVGGNESGQQGDFAGPATGDRPYVFVVDGFILSGPEEALRGPPVLYGFDPFEEPRAATGGSDVETRSAGVTIDAVTPRGTNEWRVSGRYLIDDPVLDGGGVEIDFGRRPDGTSCLDGFGLTDADGNRRSDPDILRTGYRGVVTPSIRLTLDGGDRHFGTPVVKVPACGDGPDLYAFDLDRWIRSLQTTEGAPEGAPEAAPGVRDEADGARPGDDVTFRLADGSAGVDVTLIDRGEPRPLGTTGADGVTRVPAAEVADGTALIAYAVVCGEDRQIVLVRPDDEEAFLDAYGDCAGRRLERFAWYAGDVFVDVRGLARWIPYPPDEPEPDGVGGEVEEGETPEPPAREGGDRDEADQRQRAADAGGAGGAAGEAPGVSIIQGGAVGLGAYLPDRRDERFLQPQLDLPGPHAFAVSVRGAPWIEPANGTVEISGEGFGLDNIVDLEIDTRGLAPGHHAGTVILACDGCETPHVVEIPVSIDIVSPTTFGSHPADRQFGGLDEGGQPRPIRDLLGHVVDEIEGSAFGQLPNGPDIIETLRDWMDDIVIVPTVDRATAGDYPKVPGSTPGETDDGDAIRPGEGQYQFIGRNFPLGRMWPFYSEEFYVGVDLSTQGIEEARRNPGDYYVFTHDGRMGVVRKDDLVHTLPHEGLHAHHVGEYNLPGKGASNEEELDGFRAGNAAAEALGLPPQTDAPGYGGSNPDYEPLFPAEEPSSEPSSQASIDPVISPEALGGPSGRGGASSDIEVVIRSTGGSTGAVVELYAVNHGDGPVRIRTEGLVLEPVAEEDLDPAARVRMQEILEAASSGKPLSPPGSGTSGSGLGRGAWIPGIGHGWGHGGEAPADFSGRGALLPETRQAEVVRLVLPGYCLEFAKDVPVEGTLFRIVDREAQRQAARFREIVRASRRLQERGGLHPDGDPESYFNSTRQWAAWADELALDRDGFEEAFVEHARKNFDAAGRPWTAEVEEQVRALVPNRWADLRAVLDEAELSPGRSR